MSKRNSHLFNLSRPFFMISSTWLESCKWLSFWNLDLFEDSLQETQKTAVWVAKRVEKWALSAPQIDLLSCTNNNTKLPKYSKNEPLPRLSQHIDRHAGYKQTDIGHTVVRLSLAARIIRRCRRPFTLILGSTRVQNGYRTGTQLTNENSKFQR
jgi:hypothetical protein